MSARASISITAAGGESFVAAINGIFCGFGNPPGTTPIWGVLPPTVDAEKRCRDWLHLIGKGCRGFVILDEKTDFDQTWPREFNEHRFLSPYLPEVGHAKNLEELCRVLSPGIPEPSPPTSIRRYIEAILLNKRIEKFSHGSAGDVVNLFLAPARLHLDHDANSEVAAWKSVWDEFHNVVFGDDIRQLEISKELMAACEPISKWLDGRSHEIDEPISKEIERVMMLLTQVRTLADQHSRSQQSTSMGAEPLAALGELGCFRVLVVDDHAASWRPVFKNLLSHIQSELNDQNVRIDFSLDGKFLADGNHEKVFFGSYDLILLDIFLGSRSGTDILRGLRRDFSQLPVLLWSTSRDEEITGAARLANGIILKKTITKSDLKQSIATWVERGKAMRLFSLPNPFFNHTIQDLELRDLAVDCHEWCLKQLDSFHALDNEYFRYFTDHGGRHIVKLWQLLEQSLQPFLNEEEDLLPNDPELREREIFGLYLTVIGHELGMFPMRFGSTTNDRRELKNEGGIEDFGSLGRDYLDDVRSLHAVRGMVLIADEQSKYWNDHTGRTLGLRLHKFKLAGRIAVLVGYHARVFKSLETGRFLVWDKDGEGAGKDLAKRLESLNTPTPSLSRNEDTFRDTYQRLASDFENDPKAKDRLRKQCALFRFVDALDVSFTRNPAEFLVGSGRLPAKQYGENLKRELCTDAHIHNGDVKVSMRVSSPSEDCVLKSLNYLMDKKILNSNAARDLKNALDEIGEGFAELIENPWDLLSEDFEDSREMLLRAIEYRSVMCLQKPLDSWLKEFWKIIAGGELNSDFVVHLKDLKILDEEAPEPRLLAKGAEIVAGLTALSVAGEILDEYQAIVQGELHRKIRLPKGKEGFDWAIEPWKKNSRIHESLVTLRTFVPE